MGSTIRRFDKYNPTGHTAGIWDKAGSIFTLGSPEYPKGYRVYTVVERISKPFTYYEPETDGSYAGGDFGYIKGKGIKKTATRKWYFCYEDNKIIGVIDEYNPMFQSPDRYHLILINEISPKFNLEEL